MQINVQRLSPVKLEVQVEVPADAVKAEVDKAYRNLEKTRHIKGFRPGKAPRSVLAHLFGPAVQNDVAKALVDSTLPKVLTEKNVQPVSQPEVEPGKLEANAAFSYVARFEVQPEVGDVTYEGFELVRPPTEADEKMVESQLEQLRNRQATLQAPEPVRAAAKGDVVTIDFVLEVDGKEKKDAGGQAVQLELGSGQVLPGLENALVGKSAGDRFEAEVTFPQEHTSAELRGKPGKFVGQLQDIKHKVLPALDDAFAKEVGNFQTLIELRADIHTKLQKALKDASDLSLAEQIVQKLSDANPLEVPQALVRQQADMMAKELIAQMRRTGQRVTTEEQAKELNARIMADAEKKVRAGLLMAAIAKKNGFQVTEEDIEKGIKEIAEDTGKNPAKLKVEYRDPNKRTMLIGMILEDKILDFLEAKSKITDQAASGEAKKEEGATAQASTEAEKK